MDTSLSLLLPHLHGTGSDDRCLLVADENLVDLPFASLAPNVQVLSNRFDIAQQAKLTGREIHFNDFDFSVFADQYFSKVIYRVSKEKSVTHHIINQSLRVLNHKGELILTGAKNEGIKTYAHKAGEYFASPVKVQKHGHDYLAIISKNNASLESSEARALALQKPYESLEPSLNIENINFYTKPGLFGWNKIDRGSALLAQHLNDFLGGFTTPPQTLLDLGCGYGYLSVMTALTWKKNSSSNALKKKTPLRIVATDNCAAAIIACQKNFKTFTVEGEVIAGDCAGNINETFDAVLCNPPFHQGFKTDSRLTEKFIHSTALHLKPEGRALFVANQFVPLEKLARPLFTTIERTLEADGFKLVQLIKA